MDIETRDDEKKKAPKQAEAKNGFLQNLIESIFKSSNPEAEKKRKLKAIAKSFSKTKYHNFYKTSTIEALAPFAKLFYDIYKIVAPAQTMFKLNDNPTLYKRQIISYSLSEKQVELLNHFDANKLIEMSRQVPFEQLEEKIQEELSLFSNEYDPERIAKTENIYKAYLHFKDFCVFDYFLMLKKFDSKIPENNFTVAPAFDKVNAEYIVEDLKDFISVAYPIIDESIVWTDLFDFITQTRGSEVINPAIWKKVIAKIKAIRSSGAFELMIRHISRNPSYASEVKFHMESIVEPYIESVEREANDNLSKISHQQKQSKTNSLCDQIFGTTEIKNLRYYASYANEPLIKKELNTFDYTDALNYLKAFLLEYVKKDIREFFDVVVIRGQWDATLSAPMSNAYQELLKTSDEITNFDNELAEEGSLGIKIKTLLPKTAHDPGAENIINRVVEDSNETAKGFIVTSTQNLVTIGKTLKQLIEDYMKQKPVLVHNWRELERYLDHPMKEFSVNIYKKIYLFVQLMQQYLNS